MEAGGSQFQQMREADRDHQIEQVGARLRAQMLWLDPVEVQAGQAQASAAGSRQGSGIMSVSGVASGFGAHGTPGAKGPSASSTPRSATASRRPARR